MTHQQPAEVLHEPVLVEEVLEYLRPIEGTVLDATVGFGGHARAILESPGRRRLVGLDLDSEAIASARRQLSGLHDNLELIQASYADMVDIVRKRRLEPITAVLFDFGVSRYQLKNACRGFGYDGDGPLDMRFDPKSRRPSALQLIRRASQAEVTRWLSEYGQETMAGRIGRVIHERRHEMRTTQDLVEIVQGFVPARRLKRSLSRVFQAIRIATNDELLTVEAGLRAALRVLSPAGRLLTISYHSLEDRVCKVTLREARRSGRVRLLTRRPVRPAPAEVDRNPAARSAMLRAAEVVA